MIGLPLRLNGFHEGSVMENVLGLKELTLWQALRILNLASILFGGHRVLTTEVPVVEAEAVKSGQPAH